MAEDMVEPFRRAFEAAGYAFDHLSRDRGNEALFRQRIVHSIAVEGRPAIALGVIGPPEACIVAGYDEGGEVLAGWNFFQERASEFPEQAFEPNGYYRKRRWFERTTALMTIGERVGPPPAGEVYRQTLRWALQVVGTPLVGDFYGGLRAYQAWAEWMGHDEDFPDDIGVLQQRKMVHYDAMCMVSERGSAASFLRTIAAREPAMEGALRAAAMCYDEEAASLGLMHQATGGFIAGDEQLRRLTLPAVRRQIAGAILRARDKDAQAAEYIERALAANA
jgi:hypothetical protein